MKKVILYLSYTALGFLMMAVVGLVTLGFMLNHYSNQLPDYRQLADYHPLVVSRVYGANGELLVEYAKENRVFVPINAIPSLVIKAFLSAEDKNYYDHPGVDFVGIFRAVGTNLANIGSDKRPVGASTITQQVAKNFLLSNELSVERKIKEAILAFRIERTFTKDQILELYLNEIYLGGGAYGVAAASLHYFDKPLDQLTVEEAAYLAALPKAPNNYNPVKYYDAALSRRNWVISRMYEDRYLNREEAKQAQAAPLVTKQSMRQKFLEADYFGEEVRREVVKTFGSKELYGEGLYIKTSVDTHLQQIATRALRRGLEDYDRRHGWRGAMTQVSLNKDWKEQLRGVPKPGALDDGELAVILHVTGDEAQIGLVNGKIASIPFAQMKWARPALEKDALGASPDKPSDVVAPGDVVAVRPIRNSDGLFRLIQIPEVNGALVALDPHTGRVVAMVGGYDRSSSEFNRATQAIRQPGSAIKPFVYLTALNNGYTPATMILDAPFVLDQGPELPKWKPQNSTDQFYGPSTMRLGLEKSRNLMTVRLAQAVGMPKIAETVEQFGITDNLQETLSMALGAGETTLLRLTAAYAMLVNGGREITPSLIDSIQDRRGTIVYRHDDRICSTCQGETADADKPPVLPDERAQITDPVAAYQVVSMLEGVVQRGTGMIVRSVNRPIGGKTGTSNDAKDAWFIGFSPDLAVGVFVGYDAPKSLGRDEYGSSIAAPIFRDFVQEALKGQPQTPFRIPKGVRLARINAASGLLATPGDKNVILEAFKIGSEPQAGTGSPGVLDGSISVLPSGAPSSSNLEGIY